MKCSIPFALVAALGSAACGNNSSSAGTTTAPSSTTDRFTGTVQVGSSAVHNFTVATSSQVDVTLIAAGPPDGIVMGLGVGAPDGSTCALFAGASVRTAAGSIVQLSGNLSPGTFCVSVYDIGNQTGPVDYTVTVTHT